MPRKHVISVVAFVVCVGTLSSDLFAQPRGRRGRGGATTEENDTATTPMGHGRGGTAQAGGRFGGGPGGAGGVNPLFAALDSNSDGVISQAEMEEAMLAFAKLDENKDGKLSAEEAGAAGGRGRGHGAAGRGGPGQQGAAATGGRGRGRRGGAGRGQAPGQGNTPAAGRGGRRGRGAASGGPGSKPTGPANNDDAAKRPPAKEAQKSDDADKGNPFVD